MKEPAAIRVVFFDAVGTLLYPDPPVRDVYASVGRASGARLDPDAIDDRFRAALFRQEQLDQQLGFQTDEARERRRWSAIVGEVFHDQPEPLGPLEKLWQHFGQPHAWTCYPDLAPCLERLHGLGFGIGIASNFDERLRDIVAAKPELRHCQHLAISSVIGWRKPAPAFFGALAGMADTAPQSILLVGDDRANDYQGAREAGMAAILLDRKAAQSVDGTIRSLAELPRWLSE